jgi:hypothetical protein
VTTTPSVAMMAGCGMRQNGRMVVIRLGAIECDAKTARAELSCLQFKLQSWQLIAAPIDGNKSNYKYLNCYHLHLHRVGKYKQHHTTLVHA